MDLIPGRISVDRLRKLKRGGGVDETAPSAPLKTLESASGVFTKVSSLLHYQLFH